MRQLIEVFPLSIFPAIAILIFMSIFVFSVFRVFKLQSAKNLDAIARLPLEEDSSSERGVK